MFDVKKKAYVEWKTKKGNVDFKQLKRMNMNIKRAKHCSCLFTDPTKGLKANRRVLVAGGITERTVIDVFAKKKT
jgi:hypothetical protein